MKNECGFTLIELVVTMVLFATIMLLSVPNVISMVDKNKRLAYITDAKKMEKAARIKFNSDNRKPSSGRCVVYTLSQLDQTNLNNPPNGGSYDTNLSYVSIEYNSSSKMYVYSVQLVESYKDLNKTFYRGVKNTQVTNLNKENAKMKYVTGDLTSSSTFTSASCSRI